MKKKRAKKRRAVKKTKPKEFNIIFFSSKEPFNVTLHFIGLIIMIYGAWFRNISWLILGFLPMLVGYWWEAMHKNETKK